MAEGKRPGGLTALAVLNFVFGAFAAIATLLMVAGLAAIKMMIEEAQREGFKGDMSDIPQMWAVYVQILLLAVGAILLITSGVGYLGQKKFMGRTLGNGYAVCSLAGTVLGLAFGDAKFSIGTMIFMVYPVLTLIMVNTTFKDDLVN